MPTFVRSVALLRWARENGCPWDERTCATAAAGGQLEVLQWARENGCPWDERTCAAAAAGQYLEVLQWALENSCPSGIDSLLFGKTQLWEKHNFGKNTTYIYSMVRITLDKFVQIRDFSFLSPKMTLQSIT